VYSGYELWNMLRLGQSLLITHTFDGTNYRESIYKARGFCVNILNY